MRPRTALELDASLAGIERAPVNEGLVELIVRRPSVGTRELLEEASLDVALGLLGDSWSTRPDWRDPTLPPNPNKQLNLISSRVSAALADGDAERALAGDQLHVDLALDVVNLKPGTRFALGTAVIEVTAEPHTGCKKFSARFGVEALRWVNSVRGKQLRLRGVAARVLQSGTVRRGDRITRVPAPQ